MIPSKFTPNAIRRMRRTAVDALLEYRGKRSAAMAAKNVNLTRYEDALGAALEARHWWHVAVRRLRDAEERGVEVGAAWSPKGLANVRDANARR